MTVPAPRPDPAGSPAAISTAAGSTSPFVIASMFPRLMNTNGDAANARVLARRATWAGIIDTELVEVHATSDMAVNPDVIVVGACPDAERTEALTALLEAAPQLRAWVAGGVPLVAVATGWELLSESFLMSDGSRVNGLGIFAGRVVPRAARISDDLVVDSPFGRLVGYENHSSDYELGPHEVPLGRVLYGSGNGDGGSAGTEGVLVAGSTTAALLVGTHLHGPLLAKNPLLADHLLTTALARAGRDYTNREPETRAADRMAQAACTQITTRLGL